MKNCLKALSLAVAVAASCAVWAAPPDHAGPPDNRPPDNRPPDNRPPNENPGHNHENPHEHPNNPGTPGGDNNSSATAGGSSSSAVGGESTAGASATGGNNYATTVNERDAPSAPAVYAAYCQQGASGSGIGGSAGVSTADVICDHLKLADRMLLAYQNEGAVCQALQPECDPGLKQHYYDKYREHLADADRIAQQTSLTGQVAKTSAQIAWPAALIWLVFML